MYMDPVRDITRSLVVDLDETEGITFVSPGRTGQHQVRVTLIHKSGRRAKLRVVATEAVRVERTKKAETG